MRKNFNHLAALLMCGLGLAACGGGGLDREDFDAAYGEALCHRQTHCGEVSDEAACAQHARDVAQALRDTGQAGFSNYVGSLSDGRVRFDGELARQCVQRIRDSACEESLASITAEDTCHYLVGQQRDGEPCVLNEECEPTRYCDGTSTVTPACTVGRCTMRPGLGEHTSSRACMPGLVWLDGTCQSRVAEGSPCEHALCDMGLFCDVDAWVCRRYSAEGESCGTNGSKCMPHLRCDNGTCRAFSGVGAACAPSDLNDPATWISSCQKDLFCAGEPGTVGTCQMRGDIGRPCRGPGECREGLACPDTASGTGRTCQRAGGQDERCAGIACAPGLFCDFATTTCQLRRKQGEACQKSYDSPQCLPGLECRDTCEPSFGGTCGPL